MAEGRFRADLYYRLNVIPIKLPPLRQRRDDIPLLVDHFLQAPRRRERHVRRRSRKDAMELLMKYDWPGNVRELENVIERARDPGRERRHRARGPAGEDPLRREPAAAAWSSTRRQLTLEELEKEYILKVLNYTRWQKKRASEILGINASTLYRKLQRYGLEKMDKEHERQQELVESD